LQEADTNERDGPLLHESRYGGGHDTTAVIFRQKVI
jgi:hypothetical protein